MDLSLIIVNWNTRDLLAQCLESIYTSPPDASFEVWVVDNASTDGSAQMVRERFHHVRLIENRENAGFARANNQAIQESTGRHILLLNPDTVVLPNAIMTLHQYLSAYPTAGVVGAQLLNADGSLQDSWGRFPSWGTEMPVFGPRFSQRPRSRRAREASMLPHEGPWLVDWVSGACLMVKRAVVNSVGGFDESYWLYTEDTDWCHRIWDSGWEVLFVPQAHIIHLSCAASKQRYLQTYLQFHRSRFQFLRRYRGQRETSFVRGFVAIKSIMRSIYAKRSPLAKLAPDEPLARIRYAYWRLFRLSIGMDE